MSQNTLLEAPSASRHRPPGRYHLPMASPPQPPPPPPQWGPPTPADQSRRWLPAAIIGAAILIAAAVIAAAVLISNSNNEAAKPASRSASATGVPSDQVSAAGSSTCEAWPATQATLDAIPALPAGWDWDTPGIDVLIANQNAALGTAMDLFESDIAESDPPHVAAAAREYVAAQRLGMRERTDHTYTGAGVPVTKAKIKLDHACGVS